MHPSRDAHEHREAMIDAFIEHHNMAPSERVEIEEIIEADREWCRQIAVERDARTLARSGS